jgi:hypothetical protein
MEAAQVTRFGQAVGQRVSGNGGGKAAAAGRSIGRKRKGELRQRVVWLAPCVVPHLRRGPWWPDGPPWLRAGDVSD